MNRSMILKRLEEAERHVAEAERLIAEQKMRTPQVGNDGRETTEHDALLAKLEASQQEHVGEFKDALRELADFESEPAVSTGP